MSAVQNLSISNAYDILLHEEIDCHAARYGDGATGRRKCLWLVNLLDCKGKRSVLIAV
jgi:hypothetical protein